jgi:hypothetical protein
MPGNPDIPRCLQLLRGIVGREYACDHAHIWQIKNKYMTTNTGRGRFVIDDDDDMEMPPLCR